MTHWRPNGWTPGAVVSYQANPRPSLSTWKPACDPTTSPPVSSGASSTKGPTGPLPTAINKDDFCPTGPRRMKKYLPVA